MGKLWIVYLTWNLTDWKIYVGVRKIKNLKTMDCQYLGSGKYLKRAVSLYGRENFKRIILFKYNTRKEAYQKEKEIVIPEFVKRKDTYNIKTGGEGGSLGGLESPNFGKRFSIEHRNKMSESHKGKEFTKEHCKNMSVAQKGKHMGSDNAFYGHHHTEETKKKLSVIALQREFHPMVGKQLTKKTKGLMSKIKMGKNNPFYGQHHTEKSKRLISESKGLTSAIIKQRLLDIKNEPKTWGYKTRLNKRWGLSSSGGWNFIKRYALDLI